MTRATLTILTVSQPTPSIQAIHSLTHRWRIIGSIIKETAAITPDWEATKASEAACLAVLEERVTIIEQLG